MKHRRSKLMSVLLILLCVGSSVEWVRSYWISNSVGLHGPHLHVQLTAVDGGLQGWYETPTQSGWRLWHGSEKAENWSAIVPLPHYREFAGFGAGKVGLQRDIWHAQVPFWFLTPLMVGFTIWIFRRGRARHRVGHCASCGYDLRATPDRCPECGAFPERCVVAV